MSSSNYFVMGREEGAPNSTLYQPQMARELNPLPVAIYTVQSDSMKDPRAQDALIETF
jgi:hypothetical protein